MCKQVCFFPFPCDLQVWSVLMQSHGWILDTGYNNKFCRSVPFSPATVTHTKTITRVGISPVKTWLGKNKPPVHLSVATTRLHNENEMSASQTQRTNFHDISHDTRFFFVHNNTSLSISQREASLRVGGATYGLSVESHHGETRTHQRRNDGCTLGTAV